MLIVLQTCAADTIVIAAVERPRDDEGAFPAYVHGARLPAVPQCRAASLQTRRQGTRRCEIPT